MSEITITKGTVGNEDWVYSQNLISIGSGPFPYKNVTQTYYYYLNYAPFDDMDAESVYNYFHSGNDCPSGNIYKCAFLETISEENSELKSYQLYTNNNGSVSTTWISYAGLNIELGISSYKQGSTATVFGNGQHFSPIAYSPCYFMYKGGAPLFTDYTNMYRWLTSDSVDYKSYGGIDDVNETPEVSESDNIDGDLNSYNGLTSTTGLVDLCAITESNLSILQNIISGGWASGDIGKAIISLKVIAAPTILSTSKVDNFALNAEKTLAESGELFCKGNPLHKQYNRIKVGSFYFQKKFNSFLDFRPYTSIRMYLPFVGIKNLDPEIVIGHTVTIDASIDYISGDLIYYATMTDDDGNNSTLYEWRGNCSCDIPITSQDYGAKVSQGLNMVNSIGGVVASKGLSSLNAVGSALQFACDAEYLQTGNISSNDGFSGIMYPYVIITYPKYLETYNYKSLYGKPSMEGKILKNLSGYTKVSEVHLENINCTNTELLEIEDLLKSGVII